MPIRCLFLLVGLFPAHSIFAQSVALGLQGGLGQACHHRYFDQDYDRSFQLRPIVAATIGINATFNFDNHLALETGVQYERKGNIRYATKNQYHYATLPIAIKWSVLTQQTISPYARGGGYYARLLYHQQTYISDGPVLEIYLPEYQTPRSEDFGLLAAIGADWRLSPHLQLNLDLCVTRGLSNLYGSNANSLALIYPLYNVSWNLATGVRYVL